MKNKLIAAAIVTVASGFSLLAGTPEQDKAFVEKYKAAFEKGDKATLESFLYIKNANPRALWFLRMTAIDGAGATRISKIELVDLTPDEVKEASEVESELDGSKAKLPLTPTKKLKMTFFTAGSQTAVCFFYLAEKDGKYVIPVPATVK